MSKTAHSKPGDAALRLGVPFAAHQRSAAGLSFQEAIADRLLHGFENWNSGESAWLDWCGTLYEPDAHYNIQGAGHGIQRLTLRQYQDQMVEFFAAFDVELGEFHNMLIEDDWCSIRYVVHITNKQTGEKIEQMTMEFVQFKDNPQPIGARVVEGWAISDKPLSRP